MSGTKHTPGRWAVVDHMTEVRIVCENGIGIAESQRWERDEMMANAHLIAAAPDMLEALERAERILDAVCGEYPGNLPDLVIVRAAIKKARGEK